MEQFEQHVIQQSASGKSERLRRLFPIQNDTFVQIISGFDTETSTFIGSSKASSSTTLKPLSKQSLMSMDGSSNWDLSELSASLSPSTALSARKIRHPRRENSASTRSRSSAGQSSESSSTTKLYYEAASSHHHLKKKLRDLKKKKEGKSKSSRRHSSSTKWSSLHSMKTVKACDTNIRSGHTISSPSSKGDQSSRRRKVEDVSSHTRSSHSSRRRKVENVSSHTRSSHSCSKSRRVGGGDIIDSPARRKNKSSLSSSPLPASTTHKSTTNTTTNTISKKSKSKSRDATSSIPRNILLVSHDIHKRSLGSGKKSKEKRGHRPHRRSLQTLTMSREPLDMHSRSKKKQGPTTSIGTAAEMKELGHVPSFLGSSLTLGSSYGNEQHHHHHDVQDESDGSCSLNDLCSAASESGLPI